MRWRHGTDEFDHFSRLAADHLEPDVATRWLALLKPAARLTPAASTDLVVARLGGRPVVPDDFEWPIWPGHGPLSFIAEIDLPALAATGVDFGLRLPKVGRYLAFYFDGSYDNYEGIVSTWDLESLSGASLMHVHSDGSSGREVSPPSGGVEYPSLEMTAVPMTTYPDSEHPALSEEFGVPGQGYRDWMTHPVNAVAFTEALDVLHRGQPLHQIGGWAAPAQDPVEYDVARAALTGRHEFEFGDETHTTEAHRWSLLLQIDSDDSTDMMWGDVGALYWLARDAGAAGEVRTESVGFTWQCS